MQEPLVTYDTAVLAKRKGFDWKVSYTYVSNQVDGSDVVLVKREYMCDNIEYKDSNVFSAPTQSHLQMWLREKGVEAFACPFQSKNNEVIDNTYSYFVYFNGSLIKDRVNFESFPETLELALKNGLKQLPDVTK